MSALSEILRSLLLYGTLLAAAGAAISGEIAAMEAMFPPAAIEFVEAKP
jgi:hypothetical protein